MSDQYEVAIIRPPKMTCRFLVLMAGDYSRHCNAAQRH
jgi:hypothetical protein